MLIISLHAFFAFWTLISGIWVYLRSNTSVWSKNRIWFYLIPHLITAISGLFLKSGFKPISPFYVLSVVTILVFISAVFMLSKQNWSGVRRRMLGAYIGLTIAFVGTLHPNRLFGDIVWSEWFKLSFDYALWIWIFLMILTSVGGIIFGIYDKKNLKLS